MLMTILVSGFASIDAYAAETVISVKPSNDKAAVGDTFTVDVNIAGNPGIAAVQFTLTFDKNVLDCTDVKEGTLLSGMLSVCNPDAESGAIVAAASSEGKSGDGTLATFTFKVVGAGSQALGFQDYDICDGDGNDFTFTVDGAVKGNAAGEGENSPGSSENAGNAGNAGTGNNSASGTSGENGTGTQNGGTSATTSGAIDDSQSGTTAGEGADGSTDVDTEPPVTEHKFSDAENHWAEGYINAAVDKGLFKGYEDGTFKPDNKVSRGEFVTVLWRTAGSPQISTDLPFTDSVGIWCEDAISWAYENGYVNGKDEQTFDPNGSVTRQEAMKILHLYSGEQSGKETLFTSIYNQNFADSDKIASWAKPSVYWAFYNQLITGTTDTTLDPTGSATRAQLAKILVNYISGFDTQK